MALENANSSDENVVSRVAGAYASVNDRECSPAFLKLGWNVQQKSSEENDGDSVKSTAAKVSPSML